MKCAPSFPGTSLALEGTTLGASSPPTLGACDATAPVAQTLGVESTYAPGWMRKRKDGKDFRLAVTPITWNEAGPSILFQTAKTAGCAAVLVLALCASRARAADVPPFSVEFTGQEAQFLVNLLDSAIRSGGFAVAKSATPIYAKIEGGAEKALSIANEAAHKAEIDAAKAEAVKAAAKPPELPAPSPTPTPQSN